MKNYQRLIDRLDLHQGLPYSEGWSGAEDFLLLLVEYCLEKQPGLILECGSGVSTVMMARCCQLNQGGRVVSLENGREYAERTDEYLGRYGLMEYATVVEAPLENYPLNGQSYPWYSLANLPEAPIDLLVVDGPPGFLHRESRYPAVPLLYERLADNSTVLLDDAGRADERSLVGRWCTEFSGFTHHYLELERGCAKLVLARAC